MGNWLPKRQQERKTCVCHAWEEFDTKRIDSQPIRFESFDFGVIPEIKLEGQSTLSEIYASKNCLGENDWEMSVSEVFKCYIPRGTIFVTLWRNIFLDKWYY